GLPLWRLVLVLFLRFVLLFRLLLLLTRRRLLTLCLSRSLLLLLDLLRLLTRRRLLALHLRRSLLRLLHLLRLLARRRLLTLSLSRSLLLLLHLLRLLARGRLRAPCRSRAGLLLLHLLRLLARRRLLASLLLICRPIVGRRAIWLRVGRRCIGTVVRGCAIRLHVGRLRIRPVVVGARRSWAIVSLIVWPVVVGCRRSGLIIHRRTVRLHVSWLLCVRPGGLRGILWSITAFATRTHVVLRLIRTVVVGARRSWAIVPLSVWPVIVGCWRSGLIIHRRTVRLHVSWLLCIRPGVLRDILWSIAAFATRMHVVLRLIGSVVVGARRSWAIVPLVVWPVVVGCRRSGLIIHRRTVRLHVSWPLCVLWRHSWPIVLGGILRGIVAFTTPTHVVLGLTLPVARIVQRLRRPRWGRQSHGCRNGLL